jgi:release factor glutamine methyltransferase
LAILKIKIKSGARRRKSAGVRETEGPDVAEDRAAVGGASDARINEGTNPVQPSAPVWQRFVWTLAPWTTVGRAIIAATQRLEDAGSTTAHLDAQVILAHVLGVDRSWLFAHYEYKLNPAQAGQYTDLVARRAAAEPVAYLVGHKEFYGIDFAVDRRVLIPRPETELLVDAVLDYIESHSELAGKPDAEAQPPRRLCMADVGTGSGAIAVAVATNAPDLQLYAIDVSVDALELAQRNVERWDERGQITLLQGDLLSPLPEKVDIIAANLPYVNSRDYEQLDADIRDYEPQIALEAGPEGLDTIRRLLEDAPAHLNKDGVILLEIGYDQGAAVLALAQQLIPNARYIGLRQDYHGHDRLLTIAV